MANRDYTNKPSKKTTSRPNLGSGLAERAAQGMEKRNKRNKQAECAAQGKEFDFFKGTCK